MIHIIRYQNKYYAAQKILFILENNPQFKKDCTSLTYAMRMKLNITNQSKFLNK